MIETISGNFFDHDADIRVNTVNCVGVMGAGAALQFKKQFPEMYDEYLRECNLGNVKIGKPHVWKDKSLFGNSPIIINLPTKDHWKKPSEYEYIEKALIWLRNFLQGQSGKTITVPALGCGHGGLDWDRVKPMIYSYLNDLDLRILVFEPSSSTKSEVSDQDLKEMENLGISKLTPASFGFPSKLNGVSATEFYVKGQISLLNTKLLSIIIDSKASDREKSAILNSIQALPYRKDLTLLMGYNSSFEIDAIKVAVERRFRVVIFLPYGILNLKMRKDLQAIWNDELNLIASTSKPYQSWNVGESYKSLKNRITLSSSILITCLNLEFINKIENDFRDSLAYIFYLNYWNEIPSFFSGLNALRIGRDKDSNQPNMKVVTNTTLGL